MKLLSNRQLINKLRLIETAEQYLIARTHAELSHRAAKRPQGSSVQLGYKFALAVGASIALAWMLHYGTVSDFLSATV